MAKIGYIIASEHVSKLQERMIVQLPPVSTAKERRMDREKTVINLYAAGHPIDDIWKASVSIAEARYSAY